jgi:hypothetical protein
VSERRALNTSAHTVLDASGAGRVELGPDRGAPYWNVTKLVVTTSRPGQAPVPSCAVYVDTEDANGLQDTTYDGSRDATEADIDLQRGQHLIAVWSGGQAGDTATLSVTGWTKER